ALVLGRFGFDVSSMLGSAADASGKGEAFLRPGERYGRDVPGDAYQTIVNKLDFISLALALVLGTAGLPHI
ncbi:cation acetate symporter, partial [Micromonospora aurantiaca]|nr:cation acetate symporter [Micromonospora aurantiaca]